MINKSLFSIIGSPHHIKLEGRTGHKYYKLHHEKDTITKGRAINEKLTQIFFDELALNIHSQISLIISAKSIWYEKGGGLAGDSRKDLNS